MSRPGQPIHFQRERDTGVLFLADGGGALVAVSSKGTAIESIDGCGTTSDGNDWIVDSAKRVEIRALLDILIGNLDR